MNSFSDESTPDALCDAALLDGARLTALRNYDILDTLPERAYDDLTQLAAAICRTPIAVISLLDNHRQWFKARVGMDAKETPVQLSFCRYAIVNPVNMLVIPDATKDACFCNHPLVTGEPHIRFYAGAPLVTAEGNALGTICVVDFVPRELDDSQRQALGVLARQVMALLELRRANQALSESEERFQSFMEYVPAVAFIKDENGRYLFANPLLLSRFQKTREEFVGRTDAEIWPPEMYERIRASDEAVLRSGHGSYTEESIPMPDGSTSSWLAFKFPLHYSGELRLLGGIGVDITDRKNSERQLEAYRAQLEEAVVRLQEIAVTDSLTGLKNHGAFRERLEEEVQRARRYKLPLSLAMLDVDYFKNYNDSFGHPAGDGVLQGIAELLKTHARPSDFSARYGGEEFVVILANTNLEGALAHSERIRQAVAGNNWPHRAVTVSIGVAAFSPENPDVTSLLIAADNALYKAKHAGRNRVEHSVRAQKEPGNRIENNGSIQRSPNEL